MQKYKNKKNAHHVRSRRREVRRHHRRGGDLDCSPIFHCSFVLAVRQDAAEQQQHHQRQHTEEQIVVLPSLTPSNFLGDARALPRPICPAGVTAVCSGWMAGLEDRADETSVSPGDPDVPPATAPEALAGTPDPGWISMPLLSWNGRGGERTTWVDNAPALVAEALLAVTAGGPPAADCRPDRSGVAAVGGVQTVREADRHMSEPAGPAAADKLRVPVEGEIRPLPAIAPAATVTAAAATHHANNVYRIYFGYSQARGASCRAPAVDLAMEIHLGCQKMRGDDLISDRRDNGSTLNGPGCWQAARYY